jgi:hypothetical protein
MTSPDVGPDPGPDVDPGSEPAPEPEDEGYLSLVRHLYWSQEAGARPQAGTRQVREQMLEFVAKMRTDERAATPLGEPHLAAPTPLRRKVKYAMFRGGRFATRRYDRLLGDAMDLSVALSERVLELEHEVEELQQQVGDMRHGGSGGDAP